MFSLALMVLDKRDNNESFKFPKTRRILKSTEYKHILDQGIKVITKDFVFIGNKSEKTLSRLGLIVSKRVSKKAVERNQIKRFIRESFRLNADPNLALDVIVIARPGARNCTFQNTVDSFCHGLKLLISKIQDQNAKDHAQATSR